MKAKDIIWTVDCEEDLDFLPTEVDIPEGMEDKDEISDYLSDTFGFCHEGFVLDTEADSSSPKTYSLVFKNEKGRKVYLAGTYACGQLAFTPDRNEAKKFFNMNDALAYYDVGCGIETLVPASGGGNNG